MKPEISTFGLHSFRGKVTIATESMYSRNDLEG